METRKKIIFGVVLPLLVLAAAVGAMKVMVALRRPPAKVAVANRGVLVEVLPITLSDRQVFVDATGTVQPETRISIIPQVSGRVERVSPKFRRGGFFAAGEEMFAIEDIDYRLAVEKAESQVAKRRVELASVESKAEVARREWKRLGRGEPPASSLVLYGPQLKEARASLASAIADRKTAQLNLDRTKITAPFDCVIISESVDIGQYVRAGTPVGEAVGSRRAEVVAPVAMSDLEWITLPRNSPLKTSASADEARKNPAKKRSLHGVNEHFEPDFDAASSSAAVFQRAGKGKNGSSVRVWVPGRPGEVWQGRIDRILADVDSRDRMIRLVIEVDEPFRHQLDGTGLPLPVGQFVELAIAGRILRNVAVIPRSALHDGDTVWLYDQGELEVRRVKVARRRRDEVLISSGLAGGDQVVLTMITGAAPGMKLRLAEAAK